MIGHPHNVPLGGRAGGGVARGHAKAKSTQARRNVSISTQIHPKIRPITQKARLTGSRTVMGLKEVRSK